MRDDINLLTDIYFPSDKDHNPIYDLPILLERTPYDKKALNLTLKLKNDLDFYIEVSNKAKRLYKKEFTKEKMLQLLQDD